MSAPFGPEAGDERLRLGNERRRPAFISLSLTAACADADDCPTARIFSIWLIRNIFLIEISRLFFSYRRMTLLWRYSLGKKMRIRVTS
jgi:hypothetical protein